MISTIGVVMFIVVISFSGQSIAQGQYWEPIACADKLTQEECISTDSYNFECVWCVANEKCLYYFPCTGELKNRTDYDSLTSTNCSIITPNTTHEGCHEGIFWIDTVAGYLFAFACIVFCCMASLTLATITYKKCIAAANDTKKLFNSSYNTFEDVENSKL